MEGRNRSFCLLNEFTVLAHLRLPLELPSSCGSREKWSRLSVQGHMLPRLNQLVAEKELFLSHWAWNVSCSVFLLHYKPKLYRPRYWPPWEKKGLGRNFLFFTSTHACQPKSFSLSQLCSKSLILLVGCLSGHWSKYLTHQRTNDENTIKILYSDDHMLNLPTNIST